MRAVWKGTLAWGDPPVLLWYLLEALLSGPIAGESGKMDKPGLGAVFE